MRDRLASNRPLRLVACFCLPANLISRIACTLISFWPVSQPRIDFWNIMSVRGWRALFWTQGSVISLLCVCFSSYLVNRINCFVIMLLFFSSTHKGSWFGDLRKLLIKFNLSLFALQRLCTHVVPVCSFSVLSNSFISICLTFLFPSFYFPCCFSYLVCLLCLALCVETSGYETAGCGYQRHRCLSVSPCGTLAVPYHVLLIPSL